MTHDRTIFTIGHSTRTLEEFVKLLQAHNILQVLDIRTIPRSQHNPQFNKDALRGALKKFHIGYRHLARLGGLRRARRDSANTGWRNASFRGYADYMETPEFEKGLAEAMKSADGKRSVLMCAEAVSWRCHRSLVADALVKKKWSVLHIQSARTAKLHTLTPFLRMRKGKIAYPAPQLPSGG